LARSLSPIRALRAKLPQKLSLQRKTERESCKLKNAMHQMG